MVEYNYYIDTYYMPKPGPIYRIREGGIKISYLGAHVITINGEQVKRMKWYKTNYTLASYGGRLKKTTKTIAKSHVPKFTHMIQ